MSHVNIVIIIKTTGRKQGRKTNRFLSNPANY